MEEKPHPRAWCGTTKKKRVRLVEGQQAKKEGDKKWSKTRIAFGPTITGWRKGKQTTGFPNRVGDQGRHSGENGATKLPGPQHGGGPPDKTWN